MKLPFTVLFVGGKAVEVEAVTDTGAGRFYWIRSPQGELLKFPAWAFQ